MDYYKQAARNYSKASAETKKASRAHWLKCHAENVASGRADLIMFSAQILAAYDLIGAGDNCEF